MFDCLPLWLTRVKTTFAPSGDQPGSRQSSDLGSDIEPPHPAIAISYSPLPSVLTTQIAGRRSGAPRATKRILFPYGDQLPPNNSSRIMPGGVIWRSPDPLLLTTKMPTWPLGSLRTNTSRLPSGEKSPGMSSPPAFDVICVRPPPSEERIVQMPVRVGTVNPKLSHASF